MPFPRYACLKNIGLCTFTVLYKFFATVHSAVCMINDSNKQGKILLKNRIEEEGEECVGLPAGRWHALLSTCAEFSLS